MKRKIIKMICFCSVFLYLLCLFGRLVRPARMLDVAIENYHAAYEGIYELEQDSLDVVFAGSSHVFCSVSPEDIFESQGIASYVLATSCQKVWQSYYYLKDVFQRQRPKVVALDAFMCLDAGAQTEAFNREAIDPMKLSSIKLEAIKTAVHNNPDQEDFLSYVFPVIRYHDRWESLEESDFLWFLNDVHSQTKGYIPRMAVTSAVFNENDYINASPAEWNETCREYLLKIKELCDENHAELILAKFPTCLWNGASALTMQNFAAEAGIRYLDFCADEELRQAVNIDWSVETLDEGNHLNYDGSMKVTRFMGQYLKNHYHFTDKREDPRYKSWREDYIYYKRCIDHYKICTEEELSKLADLITDDYAVVISVGSVNADMMAAEDKAALERMGIGEEQIAEAQARGNLTILQNGRVIYQSFHDAQAEWNDVIDGNRWRIQSVRNEDGNMFSCLINEKEKVSGSGAVRMVIWDQKIRKYVGYKEFTF